MPAIPASIIEPVWHQFAALLPSREVAHYLGCHRVRIPDRIVVDNLVQVLVFGCGSHRIVDATCSATALRRRRDAWISAGVRDTLLALVLGADDCMIGLALEDVSIDCGITKALQRRGNRTQPGRSRHAGVQTVAGRRCERAPARRRRSSGQPPRCSAAGAHAGCAG